MSYQDPGFRPTGWDIAGDHETRIDILEATRPDALVGWGDVGDCNLPPFTFSDDFDRADGPIGSDWTMGATSTADWTIVSDQCEFAGGSVEQIIFSPPGELADVYVEVAIPAFPRTHQVKIGPGARITNTIDAVGAAAGYYVLANQQDTPSVHNSLEIWKVEPDSSLDPLAAFDPPDVPTFQDGDVLGIRVTGSGPATLIEALLNGSVIGSVFDDGVTFGPSFDSGLVGLYANSNSSTPHPLFDDFQGGTAGGSFDYVMFGDGLKVTDEGNDTIRVDLCASDGIRFDFDNQGGYLDVQTNDVDADNYGIHLNDDTGGLGSKWEVEQALLLTTQDGAAYVLIRDAFGGITLHSADRVLIDAASFLIAAGTTIDGGGNIASNFADGVAADDLATVGQLGSSGIAYDTANSGGWLDIETTGTDGDGYGVQISDTDLSSFGFKLASTAGGVEASGPLGVILFVPGAASILSVVSTGTEISLPSGGTFKVLNTGAATILSTSETTGITTGTFDGGSA